MDKIIWSWNIHLLVTYQKLINWLFFFLRCCDCSSIPSLWGFSRIWCGLLQRGAFSCKICKWTLFFSKGNQLGATHQVSVIIDWVIALYTLTSESTFSILFSLLVGIDREKLFNLQLKLLRLATISFILMILMKWFSSISVKRN